MNRTPLWQGLLYWLPPLLAFAFAAALLAVAAANGTLR